MSTAFEEAYAAFKKEEARCDALYEENAAIRRRVSELECELHEANQRSARKVAKLYEVIERLSAR